MRLKSVLLSLAAAGMATAPAMASAAPVANPAASLSLSSAPRAGSPTAKGSGFLGTEGGAGIFAIVILAGIIAIGVIAATDDNSKSP